ncbi:hypothetical protein B0T13DRAFT_135585 [Neurospora crassa]|nr:hypothetical protein B0T13DRAFT_135585 [Neurospora crassa]
MTPMAKNGSASSLPLFCSVPLLSIGLQHIPSRSFHATLRLQILASTILNRLSVTTGQGKQRFFIPSGNGVVSGSLRVSPGLWVISAAWFGVGSSGIFFFFFLFCPGFVNSGKQSAALVWFQSIFLAFSQPFVGFGNRAIGKVFGHWCSRQFGSLDLSRPCRHPPSE